MVVVEQTRNATGYLNIIADQLHSYMTSVSPAGNGMFQQDNTLCHKIEHIWEIMGQQLRVQRPPIHNILDLRDRCLNIWYNVSPAIYQGLVTSMSRRVEAVLRTKGGSTRY
ncbi:transposase domain containing protein [Trichonephila clavipes]|nr:transposase domain containing protein [Trichonephila clavipes]